MDTFEPEVQASTPGQSLSVELGSVGRASVLRLRGALSGSTMVALEAQIDQLSYTASRDVVVDLSKVTEIDAIAAGVLFGLDYAVRARGGHLAMIGARGKVAAAIAETPFAPDEPGSSVAPIPGADHRSSSARPNLQENGDRP